MDILGNARGNITRQTNKKLRRERIMGVAQDMIANGGLEAFTLSGLAAETGVSRPTIHNLFGKKEDIVKELADELVRGLQSIMSKGALGDPIESATFYVLSLASLYKSKESFYRAAYVAGDKLGIYDDRESPTGLVQQSINISRLCVEAAHSAGCLLGNIQSSDLTMKLYDCHRVGRNDWVKGYIDLDEFCRQTLVGCLMVYAADATPELHKRLCEEIARLNSN
jgi:AcrR family transcriptional regulator|tara:strand:+ start:162 stop:833 length:672 start_codon:yes stop_codon:yes gene_type:complete